MSQKELFKTGGRMVSDFYPQSGAEKSICSPDFLPEKEPFIFIVLHCVVK